MSTNLHAAPPHLVGSAEIAEMLEVSRQYVDRLSRVPTFPEPEVELASGRVWSREAVEAWAREFRKHFCIPAGGPAGNGGATTVLCEECGRVWVWQGTAWKNSVQPLTLRKSGV
jgi:predicted DNA-binding transcriptional regulator AlpA